MQQASHPNGVTLLVRSVTPRADGVVVADDPEGRQRNRRVEILLLRG